MISRRQESGRSVLDITLKDDETSDYLNFVIKDTTSGSFA